MARPTQWGVLHLLMALFSVIISAECALLEMSRMLWNQTVSGSITTIGRLDPLRVPLIKVDQSEGDASYRVILRNLEIIGLNGSVLESIHLARGELKSNLSKLEAGYMSYSDLRDVDSIKYKFHTIMREPNVPEEGFEAVVSPINRAADIRPSSHQNTRFDRLQQNHQGIRMFEQSQQYNRRIPFHSDGTTTSDGFYRNNLKTSSNLDTNAGNIESFRQPAYVQPIYTQRMNSFQGYHRSSQDDKDTIDCDDTKTSQYGRNQGNQQYEQRQSVTSRYTERLGDVEVSASEIVNARLKSQGDDARPPALYNREQSLRSNVASSGNVKSSRNGMRERLDYIDIVYANDQVNGSIKRFGNMGIDPKENRRVYGIEDVMKNIRESTKFFTYNFTEGEALKKRNDMIEAAMKAKRLKDLIRYAKNYQEQQGYFEEGMQLIYHYGMDVKNDNISRNNGTKRTKRAHSEKTVDDDVMHVILRIRVPLLRIKSQYTLMGKVGQEMLRGNGLLVGNFTDVVGDFSLELKKINEKLMIIRAAKAKLSAKDKKINLQGMDEKGPMKIIFSHGLMAAEAIAAMLADDFATKGLSERTADALIYRMYKDLPVN